MKRQLLLVLVAIASATVSAQVQLQTLFTDNMVLQRQTNAPLWGESRPGYVITATTSWDGVSYQTTADAQGHFMLRVKTPQAGGPYDITITESRRAGKKGSSITLRNVMIGEVWLCGGQSNMRMAVASVRDAREEIRRADSYPQIRLLRVETTPAATPQTTLHAADGGWQVCSAKTIPAFSAAAYFFGRTLTEQLEGNIPIGLIESCLGSTFAEPWVSADALRQMPYFHQAIEKVATMPTDSLEREKRYAHDLEEWNARVSELDGHTTYANGRHTICRDFSGGIPIQVPGLFEDQLKENYGAFDGIVWYHRTVDIPQAWEGHELLLSLGAIDDDDIVFFNGIEVGSHLGVAFNREYKVPSRLVKTGTAQIAIRIHDTGGLGGMYSREMHIRPTDAALSSQTIPLAGTWQFLATLDEKDLPFYPTNLNRDTNVPSALYNGMIHPLAPYALRGAIWYQGESSVGRAAQYRELLSVLINDWRTQWQRKPADMAFYIAQLANHMTPQSDAAEESTWAELREAQQRVAVEVQNCGLATLIDIGEADDIHPKNKQEAGRRLALAALAQTYGQRVGYAGPQYSHYVQEGDHIRLFFTHDEGVSLRKGKAFTVAGPDRKFHWAEARIDGQSIVVSSPEVRQPVAVRYCWANNPASILYNATGLPATPFRTDQWPVLSTNNY